jgi:hypothetical protein
MLRLLPALRVATAVTVVLAAATAARGDDGDQPRAPVRTQVDVEIAIDTTGSMQPSIDQAKRDANEIVEHTRKRLPNARFAIVEFKDDGDDSEYVVRQPMTGDADLIARAVSKLSADGGGDAPEAYNLVFSRAADDPKLGYRQGSRRILFVIGDASPHGAAKSELPGCDDDTDDPHGLKTHETLATLHRARITLNMILQASSASTSLRCYRSLTRLAFLGGDAIASGGRKRGSLGDLIEKAILGQFPSVSLATPDNPSRGDSDRYTLTLRNPSPDDVQLQAVTLDPDGMTYDDGSTSGFATAEPATSEGALAWAVGKTLPAGRRRPMYFSLTGGAPGKQKLRVRARFVFPDGGAYTATTTAQLEVTGK